MYNNKYHMLKSVIALMMCSFFLITITTSCGSNSGGNESSKKGKISKIYILKNSSKYADLINEQIRNGINKVANNVAGNFKIEFSPDITKISDAEKYLKDSINADADYIVACDSSYSKLVEAASNEHKDIKFSVIEGEYEQLAAKGNLAAYRYRHTEMGYLAALAGSRLSETKKVAFIGATNDSIRNAFKKGVLNYGSQIEHTTEFLGSSESAFENEDYANTIAKKYYSMGYDIIVQSTGTASKGIFDAAVKEQKYVFGFGVDQINDVGEYAKKIFFTSIIKKYDVAAYEAVKNFDNTKFVGGKIYLGCKQDAIDYTLNNANNKILNIKSELDKAKEGIKLEKYIMPEVDE